MPLEKKTILNAVKEVKEKSGKRNFTQSVELILSLKDIDMKTPEGRIQERIELPHPSAERPNKMCVIATGEMILKAKKAKADLVIDRDQLSGLGGSKKELRKIANEYDYFIVEAPLMPLAGKALGPVLGPRGKMPVPAPPNADISALLRKYRKMVSVRMRNQPLVRCRVGSESMKEEEITENIQAVVKAVEGRLKKGLKNFRSIHIKTSMGSPVKVPL